MDNQTAEIEPSVARAPPYLPGCAGASECFHSLRVVRSRFSEVWILPVLCGLAWKNPLGSSRLSGPHPTECRDSFAPFPLAVLRTLRLLVAFMRTLPLPTSHPSHQAAPASMSILKDAPKVYANMHRTWSRKYPEAHEGAAQAWHLLRRHRRLDRCGKDFRPGVDFESESRLSVVDEYKHIKELCPLLPAQHPMPSHAHTTPSSTQILTLIASLIGFISQGAPWTAASLGHPLAPARRERQGEQAGGRAWRALQTSR
ncbi:hypothetical protein K438DRAFT_1987540 [Mycena galopus ATCC 62051]|nr:hypothetical protein K438DRAFT_1987540 [Mycena galopus ATCC 62051]